jgi:hypothetical protein
MAYHVTPLPVTMLFIIKVTQLSDTKEIKIGGGNANWQIGFAL